MSELLDRIEKEIRERLAATRAAMLEHERLQAALHALTGAGEDAARAVRERAGGSRTRAPQAAAPPAPAVPDEVGDGKAAAPSAEPAPKTPARKPAAPAKARAPRGANREAVLRVVGERPGVSAAEISAASGVQPNTLSSLLRTLVTKGELEKRPLPGGRAGYALATPKEAPAAMSEAPAAATAPPADEPPQADAVVPQADAEAPQADAVVPQADDEAPAVTADTGAEPADAATETTEPPTTTKADGSASG